MKTTLSKMICVLFLSAGYGYAATNETPINETPTNAELYEMLQATQQQLSEAKKNLVATNSEYSFKVLCFLIYINLLYSTSHQNQ